MFKPEKSNDLLLIGASFVGAALILLLCFLVNCIPICKTAQTRCDGSIVQICNANGKWEPVMDCNRVQSRDKPEVKWECCQGSGTRSSCLPKGSCGD